MDRFASRTEIQQALCSKGGHGPMLGLSFSFLLVVILSQKLHFINAKKLKKEYKRANVIEIFQKISSDQCTLFVL